MKKLKRMSAPGSVYTKCATCPHTKKMRLSKVYIWHLSPETGQKAINIKDSGKKIDTMANVSIFCGNFFN